MMYIIIALLVILLFLYFRRNSNYVYEYRNYANMGSLSQEYIATHPNRRVSDYFLTRAPGE